MKHTLPILAAAAIFGTLLSGCSPHQATYATPDEAVGAFVAAVHPLDQKKLEHIFGPGSGDLVSSGDAVADDHRVAKFMESYTTRHELVTLPDGARELQVGTDAWPFPIPLVQENGRWLWDTAAGKEEILNRRIGENELSTIQTCLAVVDAQREYAALDLNGNGLGEYAPKFFSDPGKKNGLYWSTGTGEKESPLGPLIADAEAEGYAHNSGARTAPFHGYQYKMLMSQGPDAHGGKVDYVANGLMIGGFGVIAWPASYGSSGIMTFITNQDGVVYQKDLGDDTDRIAPATTAFDPGTGWVRVLPTP